MHCSLEVRSFNQRSERASDGYGYDLATNGHDYSRWFSFTHSALGEVTSVYHPTDEDETV